MSADRHFTLAVWSVFDARWMALATSPRVELIAGLARQFQALVCWPHAMIEVAGGSDDEVYAACGLLPPPPDFNWEAVHHDLDASIGIARFHDALHPVGDPNR